jgi:Alpha/beta hydrolase domain
MFRFTTLLSLLLATSALARVERVEVVSRGDYPHGYERIKGRVYYAVDPANAHNAAIADLDKAPRNARGEVEFSGDVDIVRPKDGGNGVVFINVPNRGGRFFIDKPDEWYLRQGFTLVELAWQFDVRPEPALLQFKAPVAKGIRGHVRSDFIVPAKVFEHTIAHLIVGMIGGTGYPVADPSDAVLTERDAPAAPRRTIARTKWRFVGDRNIHLDDGFVPGKVYEIVYTAADPAVVGSGLAAVRDFASYVKNDANAIVRGRYAYAMGISQTGRFLRHFVWQGFNADEQRRQALDALLIYVAGAGRGNFNHRWAQPSRDAQPVVPAFYPVDVPPFNDDGLLERASAEHVVPKIFYVNTAYEYWSRGASLIHTTPDSARDVPPAPTSRAYFVAGLGHIGGAFPPEMEKAPALAAQQLVNPNNISDLRHGFTAALDAWARLGVDPPPSRIPKIADGTLVRPSELVVKSLHGVAVPKFAYDVYKVDLGTEPPKIVGNYVNLVPQVGADGNELAGVRLPELQIPIATYTGWNLRDSTSGFPEYRASFVGSIIAWPKSEIAALYRSADEYLGKFAAATLRLVKARFLVADDAVNVIERGVEEFRWSTK